MSKRMVTNLLAVLLVAVFLLGLLLLSGCATKYSLTIKDGIPLWESSSYREAKKVEIHYVKKDGVVQFHLIARGVTDDTAEAAMGITNTLTKNAAETGQMWIMGGPLVDMTGQPRGATVAEMAAQLKALNGE